MLLAAKHKSRCRPLATLFFRRTSGVDLPLTLRYFQQLRARCHWRRELALELLGGRYRSFFVNMKRLELISKLRNFTWKYHVGTTILG